MQNDQGQPVDLYIPRKCSWTNRILRRDDRGSVQINVGHVDQKTGMYTGEFTTFALSGFIRKKAEADDVRARIEEELQDVPAGIRNCVLNTYALGQ